MKKKVFIFSSIFFIIDVLSKIIIDNFLVLGKSLCVIKNFFYINKVYNYGASFSILSNERMLLIILTLLILVMLYLYQNRFIINKRNILAFSLVYSGILGNLINRVFLGYVIDFLDFKIFNYDYPVFNFADIFIVFGLFLIIIAIYKKEDSNEFSSK